MPLDISRQLSELLGPGAIKSPEALEDFAIDGVVPEAVVQPPDRQAVAEIMQWASKERVSVFPRGGGTKQTLGNVPARVGVVLDLGLLNRMLDYAPHDLTATVEAGITLGQLQQLLAPGGQSLRLESPLATTSTVGGILAANTTGPLQHSYGQPRDWLIGIAVVQASGVQTKAGGKVVKNVTGYDLNKLYTGSLGTLGVIVEATFKLSPQPMEQRVQLAGYSTLGQGITAGADLLRQVHAPLGVQVVDVQAARQLNIGPVTAFLERSESASALTLGFFSGRAGTVERRIANSAGTLQDSAALHVDELYDDADRPLLKQLTDLGWAWDTRPYLGIKVMVPPSAVAQVVDRCHQDVPLGLPPAVVADPGFGMFRLFWWAGSVSDWIEDSLVLETILRTRQLAREAGGFATVEQCPLSIKKQIDVWGEHPDGMDIMRRIKQKFDPQGILNPGRFLGGI